MTRPLLIVGGAPRVAVDAVRFLSVKASGDTAVALAEGLERAGLGAELLLGILARPGVAAARRYDGRDDLEAALRTWLGQHPNGVVVLSAAINDYQVAGVERRVGDAVTGFAPGEKVPSGGDEVIIRLRPAGKVIDQLAAWGHRGPLVGFKYEDAATVVASAQALQRRCGASLVVANSLCGTLQALVQANGVEPFADRKSLLAGLLAQVAGLARA